MAGRNGPRNGYSDMLKEKRTGRTVDEAWNAAMNALKDRLWKECWRDNIELPVKRMNVTEVAGMYEVEIEVES